MAVTDLGVRVLGVSPIQAPVACCPLSHAARGGLVTPSQATAADLPDASRRGCNIINEPVTGTVTGGGLERGVQGQTDGWTWAFEGMEGDGRGDGQRGGGAWRGMDERE